MPYRIPGEITASSTPWRVSSGRSSCAWSVAFVDPSRTWDSGLDISSFWGPATCGTGAMGRHMCIDGSSRIIWSLSAPSKNTTRRADPDQWWHCTGQDQGSVPYLAYPHIDAAPQRLRTYQSSNNRCRSLWRLAIYFFRWDLFRDPTGALLVQLAGYLFVSCALVILPPHRNIHTYITD